MPLTGRQQAAPVLHGAELDLVNHGHGAADGDDRVDLGRAVVGHADRLREAALQRPLHAGPRPERAAPRPVHQVEVDLVEAEPAQALLQFCGRVLARRGRIRPGRAGAELPSSPSSTEIGFLRPFFASGPEIRCQRGKIWRLLREWDVPGVHLSCTCDVPGAAFAPVPAAVRRWSADRRLSRAARAWRAKGALVLHADAVPPLASETAPAPGGRQVPLLVFSAWDSATRNAATAVVNSGASTPPAPRPLPGDVPGDRGRHLESTAPLPRAGAGVGVPAVRRRRSRVIRARVRGTRPLAGHRRAVARVPGDRHQGGGRRHALPRHRRRLRLRHPLRRVDPQPGRQVRELQGALGGAGADHRAGQPQGLAGECGQDRRVRRRRPGPGGSACRGRADRAGQRLHRDLAAGRDAAKRLVHRALAAARRSAPGGGPGRPPGCRGRPGCRPTGRTRPSHRTAASTTGRT